MTTRSPTQILRYLSIIIFFIGCCTFFTVRLVSLQIINKIPDNDTTVKTYTRYETITAVRGEIYDRNGVPLVTNDYSRSIIIDYGDLPWGADEVNHLILSVSDAVKSSDGMDAVSKMKYFPFIDVFGDTKYEESYLSGGENDFRLKKMLTHYEKAEDTDAKTFVDYLLTRWKIVDSEGKLRYTEQEAEYLLRRRYDMDRLSFGPSSPYVISEDASIKAISSVFELNLRGVKTKINTKRVYNYPGYLSHILGRTGKIPAEQYAYYRDLGYPMDAIIGTSGIESAFENYLHGTDGVITIIEDMDGNILEKSITKEAVAGKDVYLTIDIELQKVAEDSLAYRINKIASDAQSAGAGTAGADADAGAIVAIDSKTNGVLALASYPTYDLSKFDEIYQEISKDESAPLLNRVLQSSYAPGSTLKLSTAITALSEKTITANTVIRDKGIYDYYNDYKPHCWIYDMNGSTHGNINVAQAIEHSCNYFFFDVGRELGIEKLNSYCTAFGLGLNTGIELPETTGILASPEYVLTSGNGIWVPGDTLQASIGQSYNLFTPMQLACYLSTLINHGQRYSAHLLHEVYEYGSTTPIYSYESKLMEGGITLSKSHVNTVKEGMRSVMNANLTKKAFADLTAVQAAGKTGTAQIGAGKSDNATFVSFAPYGKEEPQIVIAGIIENGVSGNNTAYVVSDIMEMYFQGEANIK